jgi:hypothetical protein
MSSPPRWVVAATVPPPSNDMMNAIAPRIATKYFAGTGKNRNIRIGRFG